MILYFDCSTGISGNMIIGALLDLGVSFSWFESQIRKLKLSHYELVCKEKAEGVRFDVKLPHHDHHRHRPLSEIRDIIRSSDLPARVKRMSLAVFSTLGRAEAKVHRTTIDKVHFHEVGAVDAMIDIVGAALCLDRLGIREIHCSPINTGFGRVRAAHGWMNVPPPASIAMIRSHRIPTYPGLFRKEMSTPTGIALIGTLSSSFGSLPRMSFVKHGYGIGSYKLKGRRDALHAVLGKG